MEPLLKHKISIAKIALAVFVLLLVAVLSALIQQVLLGEHNVAITSAVISVVVITIWRLLRRSTK
ncbi:hypothetical protein HUU05_02555 [candidate division KSB1 bacterium]|nr:hypothetical protein [candidate division KSB1 bacterium]